MNKNQLLLILSVCGSLSEAVASQIVNRLRPAVRQFVNGSVRRFYGTIPNGKVVEIKPEVQYPEFKRDPYSLQAYLGSNPTDSEINEWFNRYRPGIGGHTNIITQLPGIVQYRFGIPGDALTATTNLYESLGQRFTDFSSDDKILQWLKTEYKRQKYEYLHPLVKDYLTRVLDKKVAHPELPAPYLSPTATNKEISEWFVNDYRPGFLHGPMPANANKFMLHVLRAEEEKLIDPTPYLALDATDEQVSEWFKNKFDIRFHRGIPERAEQYLQKVLKDSGLFKNFD